MSTKGRHGKLKGCLFGCGCLTLLTLAVGGTVVTTAFRGYGRAVDMRAQLERIGPGPTTYTPTPAGSLGVDRIRRFLEVRRELMPLCEVVSEHQQAFARVDRQVREEAGPSPGLFGDIFRAIRRAPRIGRDFGRYVTVRNETLLAQEMGLGEYTWLYVTGYFGLLRQDPASIMKKSEGPRTLEDRVFRDVAGMIRRLTEGLDGPELEAMRAELSALDADPDRVPFVDGLSPELLAALEPFRAELEQHACPAAGELDVVLTEKRGLGYEHY